MYFWCVGTFGIVQVLLGVHGYFWAPIVSFGYMGTFGYKGSFGHARVLLGARYFWARAGIFGRAPIFLGINRYLLARSYF